MATSKVRSMTKTELRKTYLEKRSSLSPLETLSLTEKIIKNFFANIDLTATKNLSTFIRIAKFNEIDTSPIYYRIWKDKPWIRTFAPQVDIEKGTLRNVSLFPDTPLVENRWGLREPADGQIIAAAEIDLVLVPLVAFDEQGHRVGYGKGFYDRFLARCRPDCLKIGLSYFPPIEKIDDASEHDVRLDKCITPERIYDLTHAK